MKGGNVVVAEGAIVVGGSKSVEVFLNRTAVDAAVEAELKKHPDRADIVYRAALRLLQAGKDDRASELLVRVVELVSGSLRPPDARLERAARKRLFAVSKASGLKAMGDGKHEAAATAFQRAAKAAPDTASTVEATALLADAAQARGDSSAAIGEYQRLLKESGSEIVGGIRVFDLARAAIANVILAGGRDPYKPFEEEAERRLAKAQADVSPDALVDLYRTYPNSIAAERAVLAAAEIQSRTGRPDEAISTLRLFLREFPASGRSLEAQAALVIELEKKGRFAGAASVLRRLAASGAKWEVNDGGKRIPVGEFVESRLAREEYKKVEAPAPEIKLAVTLTRAYIHTERDFPASGGAVLKPEGPALKDAKGVLLVNFGGAVKALDMATGATAWKFATDQPVRASFAHEEGLLLCSDSFIARVKPSTGSVEWRHAPPATMKGFCRAGSMLFYLTTDPSAGGGAALVALDPARGTVAWTQDLSGIPMSGLVPGDDAVAVVLLSPSQMLVFDTETGRASPPVPMAARGSGLRLVSTRRNMVVVHSEEGGLQAFELPTGNRRWWDRLEDWTVSFMTSGPAGLLVAGSERGRPAAMLLDLRSGKRRGVAESLDAVPMAPASMTDRAAAFSVKREGRGSGARAVDLADPRLKVTWAADGGRDRLQSVPLLAGDKAVVLHLAADEEGKFEWSLELLDSTGRRLQNIKGESPLERPPSIALANDSVVLFVDNKVEVYK
jgi:tetratricopeptide (TPR) repeat protein